jgi:hypothetical protein
VLDMPFTELLNLIAIEQFKNEGAKLKYNEYQNEQEEFSALMRYK